MKSECRRNDIKFLETANYIHILCEKLVINGYGIEVGGTMSRIR